jgi:hypothetical protein
MHLFTDQDIRVERVWCGEDTGTKLVLQHIASGIKVERVIGFDDESRHRRELLAELAHGVSAQYPPEDIIIEHRWQGPGKGAALQIVHTPTGISVGRVVGYEPQASHQRELLSELFARLREHYNSKLE